MKVEFDEIKEFYMKYKVYLLISLAGVMLYLFAVLPAINIEMNIFRVLANEKFNDFLIAIGTGMLASSVTALLIDTSHEKQREKLSACMKKQILYDVLSSLRYWINFDDKVGKFEWKLKTNYVKERVIECRRATDFSIPYLNKTEYNALSTIEVQLKNMQQDSEKLDEENRYKKYQQAYQYLIYNNPPLSNLMEAYEYGQILEKLFGVDDRTGYDIALSVISFNFRMKLIETNLKLFEGIKTEEI